MRDVSNPSAKHSRRCLGFHVPTFTELAREHLSDRACFIQIFVSAALWVLTHSCHFGLVTIGVIVIETISVFKVHNALRHFVDPFITPYDLWSFRNDEWTRLTTRDLLPGDLVALGANPTVTIIPCDMVLLKGTLLVTELNMEGNSSPKLKVPCTFRPLRNPRNVVEGNEGDSLPGGSRILEADDGTMNWRGTNLSDNLQPPSEDTALALVTQSAMKSSHVGLLQLRVESLKGSAKIRLEIGPLLCSFFLMSCYGVWQSFWQSR